MVEQGRKGYYLEGIDKNVRSRLWEFYVNGRTKGTIDDLVNYNEPCEESNKKTCSDLFFKPYLDAQDGKDIYEIIDRDYSPIPIPAHRDISNTDELCQTEEFTVVRYSVGFCEEYITVGPCFKEIDLTEMQVVPFQLRLLKMLKRASKKWAFEYSQKYDIMEHLRSSKNETFVGLVLYNAMNNLGRAIKKVNERVSCAQVECEQCKGPIHQKIAHKKKKEKP
ncbi:hypothetical protein Tco_0771018 [Tanacetum coccineum]|uniref:Uncharacterized protein n=1 Tax=Tanacetum coccineum TaxID=301880 RepID=A0ABQ4ZEW4_9ASTR